jgi:hypothetical protein
MAGHGSAHWRGERGGGEGERRARLGHHREREGCRRGRHGEGSVILLLFVSCCSRAAMLSILCWPVGRRRKEERKRKEQREGKKEKEKKLGNFLKSENFHREK